MERISGREAGSDEASGPGTPFLPDGSPPVEAAGIIEPGLPRAAPALPVVIGMDPDCRIRDWDRRAEALFGWTAAEAIGRDACALLVTEFPLEVPDLRATLARDSVWRGRLRHRRRDGTCIVVASTWLLQRHPADGTPCGMVEVLDAGSASAFPAATPNRSEQRLRLAQEAAGVGTWEWDIRADVVSGTAMAFEHWGIDPPAAPLSAAALRARVHPDDLPGLNLAFAQALEAGARCQHEFRILRADGEQRWLAAHGRVVRSASGEPLTMLGATVDITDRITAAKALEEREAYLRAVLETVPGALVVVDEDGAIQSFSATAERMFGYAAGEMSGTSLTRLMPQPDRCAPDDVLKQVPEAGERQVGSSRIVTGQRRNGEQFPMEFSLGEIHGTGRRLFTGFMRDVSERTATQARLRELQAELQHVSRRSAMGEMASALAHELNQPLTATANFIHAAQRMLATAGGPVPEPVANPVARDVAATIQRAAEQALRAGQIIRRVRDFVAWGEAEQRSEPVAKLVEEAVALALLGVREAGVRVTLRLAPDLPDVLADRIQIQQVLVNLIRNGAEALESARTDDPAEQELTVGAASCAGKDGGNYVEISVADRGPGLASEVARNLFQPFVTTKRHGMGVGLSVCRSIVEAHGGRLWAEARSGRGTVFRFTLPVAT